MPPGPLRPVDDEVPTGPGERVLLLERLAVVVVAVAVVVITGADPRAIAAVALLVGVVAEVREDELRPGPTRRRRVLVHTGTTAVIVLVAVVVVPRWGDALAVALAGGGMLAGRALVALVRDTRDRASA